MVYEDRLSDAIPDELWTAKSAELQEELRRVRTEMERHEVASEAYEAAGLQILELAQTAYSSYVAKNPQEQARLVKTLVSNSTFDRGSLSPTYIKPFDVLANGCKTGDWLLRLDSNQQPSGKQAEKEALAGVCRSLREVAGSRAFPNECPQFSPSRCVAPCGSLLWFVAAKRKKRATRAVRTSDLEHGA